MVYSLNLMSATSGEPEVIGSFTLNADGTVEARGDLAQSWAEQGIIVPSGPNGEGPEGIPLDQTVTAKDGELFMRALQARPQGSYCWVEVADADA